MKGWRARPAPAVAVVDLAGTVALLIFRPESATAFTTLLIIALGLATISGGRFYTLGTEAVRFMRRP